MSHDRASRDNEEPHPESQQPNRQAKNNENTEPPRARGEMAHTSDHADSRPSKLKRPNDERSRLKPGT